VQDGATLAQIIEENGDNLEDVMAQIVTAVTQRIEEAVANENLTRAQADGLLEGLEERITDILSREHNPRLPQDNRPGNRNRQLVRLVAEATGLEVDEVVSQVQDGKSLANVLTENDIDVNAFVDERAAQHQERLNEGVERGRITQAVADARMNLFRVELMDRLNRIPPQDED
jgi:hypothetical protein